MPDAPIKGRHAAACMYDHGAIVQAMKNWMSTYGNRMRVRPMYNYNPLQPEHFADRLRDVLAQPPDAPYKSVTSTCDGAVPFTATDLAAVFAGQTPVREEGAGTFPKRAAAAETGARRMGREVYTKSFKTADGTVNIAWLGVVPALPQYIFVAAEDPVYAEFEGAEEYDLTFMALEDQCVSALMGMLLCSCPPTTGSLRDVKCAHDAFVQHLVQGQRGQTRDVRLQGVSIEDIIATTTPTAREIVPLTPQQLERLHLEDLEPFREEARLRVWQLAEGHIVWVIRWHDGTRDLGSE